MPWPNTVGSPAAWAATSSWCIGLKSPDAPAYITRSVRVELVVELGGGVALVHVVEEQLLLTHLLTHSGAASRSLTQLSTRPKR